MEYSKINNSRKTRLESFVHDEMIIDHDSFNYSELLNKATKRIIRKVRNEVIREFREDPESWVKKYLKYLKQ